MIKIYNNGEEKDVPEGHFNKWFKGRGWTLEPQEKKAAAPKKKAKKKA